MTRRRWGWVVPLLALAGFADAAYLAVLHWQGEVPPCGGYLGCAQVNTSPYAEIFGVPIAAFGALLYAGMLLAGLWRWRAGEAAQPAGTLLLYAMSLSAAIFMAYLTGIELMVLKAICYWCVVLAMITLALLALVTRDVWDLDRRAASYRPASR